MNHDKAGIFFLSDLKIPEGRERARTALPLRSSSDAGTGPQNSEVMHLRNAENKFT